MSNRKDSNLNRKRAKQNKKKIEINKKRAKVKADKHPVFKTAKEAKAWLDKNGYFGHDREFDQYIALSGQSNDPLFRM